MSYEVNQKTMLFNLYSLTWEELSNFVRKIVLSGYMNMRHPSFQEWMKAGVYDERQALLTYKTSFPQHALLSLVDWFEEEIGVVVGS